eukprot:8136431-Pyramimonas_sp.AAC.1
MALWVVHWASPPEAGRAKWPSPLRPTRLCAPPRTVGAVGPRDAIERSVRGGCPHVRRAFWTLPCILGEATLECSSAAEGPVFSKGALRSWVPPCA